MNVADAQNIHISERDRHLDLLSRDWVSKLDISRGWTLEAGDVPVRRVRPGHQDDLLFPQELEEVILRFPSAPIHGVQRLQEYHAQLPRPETMHTMRVFRHPDTQGQPRRIFLMCNGLNENKKMVLYYQLASQLIGRDPDTVCILNPFPGHLSRYPWDKFGETPLDRYLWDGSHLFRQFLRHMTETQWLLSALVCPGAPIPDVGAPLLMTEGQTGLSTQALADKMTESWGGLLRESSSAIDRARRRQTQTETPDDVPRDDTMLDVVNRLRSMLSIPSANSGDVTSVGLPSMHVIGYSLGGFAAQSTFMTWPSLISSCSALLSGGALRELTPVEFAHHEEWQTVLHSLRYELDDGMVNNRYADHGMGIAGLPGGLFHHFQRAFYEVFQQEYHGSFQTRVAAFRKRLLFVVGGDDPIVSPKAVLASSPDGGMNILEIGGMGHFLSGEAKTDEDKAQLEFWIQHIGTFIHEFSQQAWNEHQRDKREAQVTLAEAVSVETSTLSGDGREEIKPPSLAEGERLALRPDGALDSALFGRYLDDLFSRIIEDGGLLWIFRNEIPTIMLDPDSLRRRAHSLFHDERSIASYCLEVQKRKAAWLANRPNVVVVLPWNVERILVHQDEDHGFASQAESAMGPLRTPLTPKEQIERFRAVCGYATQQPNGNAIHIFDGRHQTGCNIDPSSFAPPSLPDCWLYTSRAYLGIPEVKNFAKARDAFVTQTSKFTEMTNEENGEQFGELSRLLRDDDVRLIEVSRARFNPRYRGRRLLNTIPARQVLRHAARCLNHTREYDLQLLEAPSVFPSFTVTAGEEKGVRGAAPVSDYMLDMAVQHRLTGRRITQDRRQRDSIVHDGTERRQGEDRRKVNGEG
jgi:pimeloyl-ACP methyl ester carboxylesterase